VLARDDDDPLPVTSGRTTTSVPAAPQVPDVAVPLLDGGTLRLSELGRSAVISFAASWCVPCREQLRTLQRIHEREGSGLEVITIATQDATRDVRDVVEEAGVTFPVGLDPDGLVMAAFDLGVLPSLVFVDATGRIAEVSRDGHLDTLVLKVDELLGRPARGQARIELSGVLCSGAADGVTTTLTMRSGRSRAATIEVIWFDDGDQPRVGGPVEVTLPAGETVTQVVQLSASFIAAPPSGTYTAEVSDDSGLLAATTITLPASGPCG
jgi:peroxiredoxin